MKIKVVDCFAALQAVNGIMRQEMDMDSAEAISTFFDAYLGVMQELDAKRQELMEIKNEGERIAALEDFAKEERELSVENFNVKKFPFLRLSPDDLVILKRAGLYA
jgi:hypothetical protein